MTKEKAIKILEEIIDEGWLISDMEKCTAIDACEMAIKALEQEPRWIPVSERLPETNDEVLVTYIVNGNRKKRYVETANYYGDEWCSVNDEYRIPYTTTENLAWMPLPEPYKAESEGKQ